MKILIVSDTHRKNDNYLQPIGFDFYSKNVFFNLTKEYNDNKQAKKLFFVLKRMKISRKKLFNIAKKLSFDLLIFPSAKLL